MAEFKDKGRENVKETEERFNEVAETTERNLEERNINAEILNSLEGVDDDDKVAIEEGKERSREIAVQLAESESVSPKNEINSNMDNIVTEMKDLESREQGDAGKVNTMDGNYDGVGSDVGSKFEESAREFHEIATSGEEIKVESNDRIDSMIKDMQAEW